MSRKDIDEDRARNEAQRVEFVVWYANWVKRTPNEIWSMQHKRMVNSALKAANTSAKRRR